MNWLEEKRREKGMTQDAVALKAKVARASYTNIEAGRRRPSVDVAKRIASVLDFAWMKFFE